MDRFLYAAIGNDVKMRAMGTRRLQAVKLFGRGSGRWPLFCALVLMAAMIVSSCVIAENAREDAQPVFFSMLFPQLVPEFAAEEGKKQGSVTGKAVML